MTQQYYCCVMRHLVQMRHGGDQTLVMSGPLHIASGLPSKPPTLGDGCTVWLLTHPWLLHQRFEFKVGHVTRRRQLKFYPDRYVSLNRSPQRENFRIRSGWRWFRCWHVSKGNKGVFLVHRRRNRMVLKAWGRVWNRYLPSSVTRKRILISSSWC